MPPHPWSTSASCCLKNELLLVGLCREHCPRRAALEVASTVAQDGQAAGTEARKGGSRPARVGGPSMPFMYRFLRTFCNHVRATSCDVLVCQLGG